MFLFLTFMQSSGTIGEHAQLVRTRKAAADTTRLMFHENDVGILYMIRSTKTQYVPSEKNAGSNGVHDRE